MVYSSIESGEKSAVLLGGFACVKTYLLVVAARCTLRRAALTPPSFVAPLFPSSQPS